MLLISLGLCLTNIFIYQSICHTEEVFRDGVKYTSRCLLTLTGFACFPRPSLSEFVQAAITEYSAQTGWP